MVFFEWNEDQLSIGDVKIDAQHKKLIDIVNRIHDAKQLPTDKKTNGGLLDELISYTLTHFADEETYMASIDYPKFMQHKVQQKALVTRVLEIKKSFDTSDGAITQDILNFVKAWLVNHILGHDMKYAEHAKTKKMT